MMPVSVTRSRRNVDEKNPEEKVGEFIRFLPVIAYDGSSMKEIDAGEILDIAMAGTSISSVRSMSLTLRS